MEDSFEQTNPELNGKLKRDLVNLSNSLATGNNQGSSLQPHLKSKSQKPMLRGGEQVLMKSTDFYKVIGSATAEKNGIKGNRGRNESRLGLELKAAQCDS
jgi:hypothetical protein